MNHTKKNPNPKTFDNHRGHTIKTKQSVIVLGIKVNLLDRNQESQHPGNLMPLDDLLHDISPTPTNSSTTNNILPKGHLFSDDSILIKTYLKSC